jgi:hypothetical protein
MMYLADKKNFFINKYFKPIEIETNHLPNTGRRANRSAEQFRVNIDANGDARIPTVADGPSLNIDRTGTRSFNVTVQTMKNVAKRKRQLGKRSVVVSAIGDALANTHFYTGSGMSIGSYFVIQSEQKIYEVLHFFGS